MRRGAWRGGAENGSYVNQGVYRVYALMRLLSERLRRADALYREAQFKSKPVD
ncbi:MAG TPA: hypothetical protein VMT45_05205 [Thermoanaerobaculaceae bacterium]|nr:hypothetical protein [Thermoanaerobaculaceae bacterium]